MPDDTVITYTARCSLCHVTKEVGAQQKVPICDECDVPMKFVRISVTKATDKSRKTLNLRKW